MLNRLHNLGMSGCSDEAAIALLDIPQPGCVPFVIGTIGASLEVPADFECPGLNRNDERLLNELSKRLDHQLLTVLDSRSLEEFTAARGKIWPNYCRALRALSDTLRNMASEEEIARVSKLVVADLTADIVKERAARFNEKLADQATFTIWVFSKMRGMIDSLAVPPKPELRPKDLQLCNEYRLCSLWAQFHMDLVVAANKFQKTISDDVQNAMCDGLRSAVNAYAIMKEAYALRHPRAEQAPVAELPWDEEDEQLLAASMRELDGAADSL